MVEVDEKGRKYGIENGKSLNGPVLHIRDVTEEEAKRYISDFLKKQTGEAAYYSDISENLGIELRLVVRVCEELKKEGLIEVCSDKV